MKTIFNKIKKTNSKIYVENPKRETPWAGMSKKSTMIMGNIELISKRVP